MTIKSTLSHVAVLVRSLEKAVKIIQDLGLPTNPYEEFNHEGTRECYVGTTDKSARLLLLEAIKEGPYMQALEKRGPGIHHLGVWIPNLEEYADQLGSAGWLLHAKSLASVRKQQTAYFARPGVPYLVEAWEHVAPVGPSSIEQLDIQSQDLNTKRRTDSLGVLNSRLDIHTDHTKLLIEGREIFLNELSF